jgi:Protein of unknown function (DUF3604)
MILKKFVQRALALTCLALSACGTPQTAGSGKEADVTNTAYPEAVFWGDTHLHTSNSSDAFAFGVRIGPEEALRFARGEEVTSTSGLKAKLDRPLDFLVIADHSDGLAALKAIHDAPRLLIRDPALQRWHDMLRTGPKESMQVAVELIDGFSTGKLPPAMMDRKANEKRQRSTWAAHLDTVERYNEPGKFSAFGGFEYTLMRGGDNLHRVVMFRDGKERTAKVLPYSSLIGTKPDDLWDYMDAYEKATGGQVLAIPHNSNLSNGLMFQMVGPDGAPMTAAYAKRRAAREPLVEATQIKGDSEAHPFLSPNDEFADFGKAGWDLGNLTLSARKTNDMLAGDHVREALKRGLAIEARTGVNPYKFGLIGSTDAHTALATGDESNFFGKHSGVEPNAVRASSPQGLGSGVGRIGWQYLAGGYAAVWAKANTRAAIFDAMVRRETYATSGPRMTVRFFGGWDFTASDLKSDWVKAGYARGVPMGGDLAVGKGLAPGKGKAPTFIISALKDPQGANLDRVQVVKGWTDKAGALREQIYNVSWSSPETRRLGASGKLPAVGDTVDLRTATYKNNIGAPQLATVWIDPDFNPADRAFYYLRVLEIPTPRWVLFDALRYGAKLGPDVRLKDQERAYTSPIWYRPKG